MVVLSLLVASPEARAAGCDAAGNDCPLFGYYWDPGFAPDFSPHANVAYFNGNMVDNGATQTNSRLATLATVGLKGVLGNAIYFHNFTWTCPASPSETSPCTCTGLNNEAAWSQYAAAVDKSRVAGIYLPDEPYHIGRIFYWGTVRSLPGRGGSLSDRREADQWTRSCLDVAVARYTQGFPGTPIYLVEAAPIIVSLEDTVTIPGGVSAAGFDCYNSWDACEGGMSIPTLFSRLDGRLAPGQKLLMVPPARIPPGGSESTLRTLIGQYLAYFQNPSNVSHPFKGMLAFNWGDYVEGWPSIVQLSAETRTKYAQVGRAVLGLDGGGTGGETVWVEDAVPAGAIAEGTGEGWSWEANAFSGQSAHVSANLSGVHQHYFHSAPTPLAVGPGARLFTHVYLEEGSRPRQLMLQWNDGSWEHRAYWGESLMGWGTEGTASRRYMGPLPASGGWVRLEVPASAVGLEGSTLNGMAFTLFDGKARWDRSGVTTAGSGGGTGGVSVGGGYTRVDFATTDTRRTTSTGNWRPGSLKGECGAGERITGLSKYASPPYHGHGALCAPAEPAYSHAVCRTYVFASGDDRGTTATGDWAPGYYKGECAVDEYMAGVSQTPDGQLDAILCCKGAVAHNSCTAPIFLDTSARESTATGEWDSGFWKGECGAGRYAAGLSRQPGAWWSAFSLLCCAP